MKQNQCESYIVTYQIIPSNSKKGKKKKKNWTKLNVRDRESERLKDAATVSLSVETWALDIEC